MKARDSFGNWLRQRRKALDLTQIDLADQVGCSVVTVRKIEADERRPSKQITHRLADGLWGGNIPTPITDVYFIVVWYPIP